MAAVPFRPSRARTSLSSATASKENDLAPTPAPTTRRKRAQSLGGDALDQLKRAHVEDLSPGKKLRRGLVPRRSILKVTPAVSEHANTTNFTSLAFSNPPQSASTFSAAPFELRSAGPAESESDEDSDNGEQDMDITQMEEARSREGAEERRKSMARRVSFAPNAHIRTFTPDKPTAQAQQAAAAAQDSPSRLVAAEASVFPPLSPDSSDEPAGEISMDQSEQSMEMAGDEVTRAFAGHFGGTVPASVYAADEDEDEDALGAGIAEELEDGTQEMDVAEGDEMTRFFTKETTAIHNAQPLPSALRPAGGIKPRKSVGLRMQSEDDDDELVMKSLGLGKGNKPRPSVAFGGGAMADEDEDDTEDEQDKTMAMDMTVAMGGTILSATEPRAVGFGGFVDESFEGDESNEGAGDDKTMDMEKTMDMDAATSNYGSILSSSNLENLGVGVLTPTTATARLQAQLFARQSLGGVLPGTVAVTQPMSPRRLALPRSAHASPYVPLVAQRRPHKVAPSVHLTPTRSPGKKSAALVSTRSPGGSLSLRGMLLQEQHARTILANSPVVLSMPAPSSLAHASPLRAVRQTMGSPSVRTPKVEAVPVVGGWVSPSVGGGWASPLQTRVTRAGDKVKPAPSVSETYDENAPAPFTSLSGFLQATDVRFAEDVLAEEVANGKRRQSIAPAAMGRAPAGPPSTGDIAVAGGAQSLFWQLYQSDHGRLQEAMQVSNEYLRQVEEFIEQEPPAVFLEWSKASEAHRQTMQSQFRMINTQYRAFANTEWNVFRSENYERIIEAMEENLAGLQAEAKFEEVLPQLHERRAALLAELHAERARDLELSACDQEQLLDLRSAVAEQSAQVEVYQRGFDEADGSLGLLMRKAEDLAAVENGLQAEVDGLRKMTEEGRSFTQSNYLRMKAEFEAIQYLHSTTLQSFTSTSITLLHFSELQCTLTLDAKAKKGIVRTIALEYVSSGKEEAWRTELKAFCLEKVRKNLDWCLAEGRDECGGGSVRVIIQRVLSLWLNVRHLATELYTAALRQSLSIQTASASLLSIDLSVHVPKAASTFIVRLSLTGEELFEGEGLRVVEPGKVVEMIGVDVKVLFGFVDAEEIKYVVRDTLETFGRGAIDAACRAVEAKYE